MVCVLHIAASAYPWPIVVECFYLSVDSERTMAGIFSVLLLFVVFVVVLLVFIYFVLFM